MLLTPTYHVFDLYKVPDAKWLPVQLNSPDYTVDDQKLPALNVSASQDSTVLCTFPWLILILKIISVSALR
jgi:alpha-N-arabinofuranosidase